MGIIGNIGGGGQGTPESVVTGTGGYTIPAGKFGYLQATCLAVGATFDIAYNDRNQPSSIDSQVANDNSNQWLIEGNTITVGSSYPSGTTPFSSVGQYTAQAYSQVFLNGVTICNATIRMTASSISTNFDQKVETTGAVGWSVAIYSV